MCAATALQRANGTPASLHRWSHVSTARMHEDALFALADEAREELRAWSKRSDKYDEFEFNRAYDSYETNHARPIRIGTLFKFAEAKKQAVQNNRSPRDILLSMSSTGKSEEMRKRMADDKFIIKGLAINGQNNAIYAPPNSGKTLIVMHGLIEAVKDGVIKGMFAPPSPPSYLYQGLENNPEGLQRLRDYQLSSRQFTLNNFENDHVRAFILGWAMAPQTLPDQLGTAQGFYVMIPSIHYFGQSIPEGGSGMLSESMKSYIEAQGSKVMTGATVRKFITENGECKGVRLENGDDLFARHAVVSSLDPYQTFLTGFEDNELPAGFKDKVRAFTFGDISIARVHYALDEVPQFKNGPEMNKTAYQRMFGTMADIDKQYQEISAGLAPTDPFLWTAAWTTMDPTRAPEGKHTLIMDTFVPVDLASGQNWETIGAQYCRDTLLGQLRNYTTNMTNDNILAEYVETGPTLERANLCFHRGVTTGGERTLSQMGAVRPIPNYANYRGPVKKFYMTGPSCHPGGGINGMGTIAANEILLDMGVIEEDDDFDF